MNGNEVEATGKEWSALDAAAAVGVTTAPDQPEGTDIRKRIFIGLVILGLFASAFAAFQPSAEAFNLNPDGCRWSGSQPAIGYRFGAVIAAYKSATRTADSKWDATSANGYFYETTSGADDDVVVYANWYGSNGYLAWVSGSCGADDIWNDPLYLRWNQTYLDSKTSTERYVIGIHEFGHVYGLAHNNTGTCSSGAAGLMHEHPLSKYDDCGWTSPSNDDMYGVLAIY